MIIYIQGPWESFLSQEETDFLKRKKLLNNKILKGKCNKIDWMRNDLIPIISPRIISEKNILAVKEGSNFHSPFAAFVQRQQARLFREAVNG